MSTLSKSLDDSRFESLAFSNRLMEAQSAVARDTEQFTNLTRQIAATESEKNSLAGQLAALSSQMTNQTSQLADEGTARRGPDQSWSS